MHKYVIRKNFFQVNGWMLTDLELKNSELLIYAIIYGFSQDGHHKFNGSLQYLAEWTNTTTRNVSNALKSLVDKNYILKETKVDNGVTFNEYMANPEYILDADEYTDVDDFTPREKSSPPVKKFHTPHEKISTNNINNNIVNTSYLSDTSYYHTPYDNTRTEDTRKPEPSVQSDRAVAKTLKLNNKTKNRVNSVLAYIQKRNVNQRVYSLFIDYLTSLVELDKEFSFKSMQKQIDALLELTVEQQIKALNETIIKGWRYLKYSVDNIKNMAASPNKNECVKPIAKQQYTEEEKKQILERCKNQPIY